MPAGEAELVYTNLVIFTCKTVNQVHIVYYKHDQSISILIGTFFEKHRANDSWIRDQKILKLNLRLILKSSELQWKKYIRLNFDFNENLIFNHKYLAVKFDCSFILGYENQDVSRYVFITDNYYW